MLLAIKRNGKWERTDRLDRLCWRLGPTFIRLNRRLDYFRDRWFPRAEATDIADGLEIDLPTTRDADGNEVVVEDFDEIAAFIEDNKSDFYEWRRENNEW